MMNCYKYLFLAIILLVSFQSCKDTPKINSSYVTSEIAYTLKGEAFDAKSPKDVQALTALFENLKPTDTVDITVKAKVNSVCKNKGCWMTLELDNDEMAMVKFKDYGFFVPKDIDGEEVIIHGKAFVKEVSVDEQRHYAEDAGDDKEAIAAITQPKRTYSITADGVLVNERTEETTTN